MTSITSKSTKFRSNVRATSVHTALRDHLRDHLLSNYAPGVRLPSERQLAQEHQVSTVTVARALQELSRDGILYRVPGSGTYLCENPEPVITPKPLAVETDISAFEQLTSRSTTSRDKSAAAHAGASVVIAIFGRARSRFEATSTVHLYLSAIERHTSKLSGKTIIERIAVDSDVTLSDQIELVIDRGATNFVLLDIDPLMLLEFQRANSSRPRPIPLIFVPTSNMAHPLSDMVRVDARYGAYLSTEHLIRLGHRKIAFLSPGLSTYKWVQERIDGFHDAKLVYGLPPSDDVISAEESAANIEGEWDVVPNLVADLFFRADRFTACLAANDRMAIGVIDKAAKYGPAIPKNVSLVGMDDSYESSVYDLTTVHWPAETLGQRVAELAIRQVEGLCDDHWVDIAIKPMLVVRGTTAHLRP